MTARRESGEETAVKKANESKVRVDGVSGVVAGIRSVLGERAPKKLREGGVPVALDAEDDFEDVGNPDLKGDYFIAPTDFEKYEARKGRTGEIVAGPAPWDALLPELEGYMKARGDWKKSAVWFVVIVDGMPSYEGVHDSDFSMAGKGESVRRTGRRSRRAVSERVEFVKKEPSGCSLVFVCDGETEAKMFSDFLEDEGKSGVSLSKSTVKCDADGDCSDSAAVHRQADVLVKAFYERYKDLPESAAPEKRDPVIDPSDPVYVLVDGRPVSEDKVDFKNEYLVALDFSGPYHLSGLDRTYWVKADSEKDARSRVWDYLGGQQDSLAGMDVVDERPATKGTRRVRVGSYDEAKQWSGSASKKAKWDPPEGFLLDDAESSDDSGHWASGPEEARADREKRRRRDESQQIDWNAVQARAKKMSDDELEYAIRDCRAAAAAMGREPRAGKDQGYYDDEASVYSAELSKRKKSGKNENATPLREWIDVDVVEAPEDGGRTWFVSLAFFGPVLAEPLASKTYDGVQACLSRHYGDDAVTRTDNRATGTPNFRVRVKSSSAKLAMADVAATLSSSGFFSESADRADDYDGVPEPHEPSDAAACTRCGAEISDADYDDNGGLCADCAAED